MSTIPATIQHYIEDMMGYSPAERAPKRRGVAFTGQTPFIATILDDESTGILTAGDQYVASNDPNDPLVVHIWCHVEDGEPLGITQPLDNIRFTRRLFDAVPSDTVQV